MRKSIVIAVAAALGVALTAACGEDGEDVPDTGDQPLTVEELVSAAEAEGQLTFYSSTSEDISQQIADGFHEAYPEIEVTLLRLASGQLNTRFASEAESGVHEADVFDTSTDHLFRDNSELFVPLSPELVPNLAGWPSEATEDLYVTSAYAEHIVVYNTDEVTEPPQTWEDILDPQYRDRCVMVDPDSTPVYMSWLALMHETYGDEFLTQLRDQNCILAASGVPTSQEVAAGGGAIGFPPVPSHVSELISNGAPVDIARPAAESETRAHGPAHFYALTSNAPHPHAARLFLHWYLTEEAQRIGCAEVYATALPDVSGCDQLSDQWQSPRFDLTDEEMQEIRDLVGLG